MILKLLNRTTKYMLPFVTDVYDESMMCYLALYELGDIDDKIYLTLDRNNHLINIICKQDNYVAKSFIKDKIILVLKIPNEHVRDFNKFLIGAYSKIKNRSKIIQYWAKYNNELKIYFFALFYNDEVLRKELLDTIASDIDYDEVSKILNKIEEVDSKLTLKHEIYETISKNN